LSNTKLAMHFAQKSRLQDKMLKKQRKNFVIYKYKCTFVVEMREVRDEGTVSPLIFIKSKRDINNN
jgi:hypothetical protein